MKFIRGRDATVFFSNNSDYKLKRRHGKTKEASETFSVPIFSWEVSLLDKKKDKYTTLKVFSKIKDAKEWAERHRNGTKG